MTHTQLAAPDNSADCTIVLRISGNRLASVLNAVDSLAYETGRHKFEGNNIVGSSPWWSELREITEAMRDELSAQRMAAR